ncbi:chitinase [Actinosynnema sp. ALI-1.44]|uniref:chitinase n=1 Tax=Actinosynnema sp. ALI-1.44 TaxID=1933779 RepID=UPI00117898A0|nr:chitinase [Actinosynnema sp. ALI-1.44]
MKIMRRILVAATAVSMAVGLAPPSSGAANAAVNPILASPYLYQWSSPPNPVTVMQQTGIKAFTLAFILSNRTCNPMWDGNRPLTGADITRVNQIRAAGGDALPSIGGWSGNKLGTYCSTAQALAGAYVKVIDAGKFTAIDLDIENTDEFQNAAVQDKILNALKIVREQRPSVKIVITIPALVSGLDTWGNRLVQRAKDLSAPVDVWTVMPFNFSSGGDMVAMTKSSVTGLKDKVKSVYGLTDDAAWRRSGLSSMNGRTDTGEIVTAANFRSIVSWANSVHLARVSFWALNRDCNNCGGIPQGQWEFTKANATVTG